MKARAFRLPTDLPKNLRDSTYDGRITRVALPEGSELFFTRAGTDAHMEALRMFHFGVLFRNGAPLVGVAYGHMSRTATRSRSMPTNSIPR